MLKSLHVFTQFNMPSLTVIYFWKHSDQHSLKAVVKKEYLWMEE